MKRINPFIFSKAQIGKTCIVHFNLLLLLAKISLAFLVDFVLSFLITPKSFVIWLIFIILSALIDAVLIIFPPKFFIQTELNKDEQQKYGMNSEELRKYLNFWPKVRLTRNFCIAILVLTIFPSQDWQQALTLGLLFGVMFFDTFARHFFSIKTPLTYKTHNGKPVESIFDLHRNDSAFPGTAAWTAVESLKSLREDNRSRIL